MSEVVIVGAGMAGLVCAVDLTRAGVAVTLVEASDGIGGRVRTDAVDGFRLDRGFQILLTGYPQVKQRLDLDALALAAFIPGARVRTPDGMSRLSDPLRHPQDILATVRSPVATLRDKLAFAGLVLDVCATPPRRLLRRPDMATGERLARAGFSRRFVDGFWRPFFAGIQLDPGLEVSARRFDITLRMLALGGTGLPRAGIAAIPAQIAEGIPRGAIRLQTPVARVAPGTVTLASGEQLSTRAVVVATDGPAAHRLLGASVPDPGSRPVAAGWFSLPAPPVRGRYLMLDGVSGGPAQNVVVMSEVQPSYAPAGRALVVAAVPGPRALDPDLPGQVRTQLSRWFDVDERELELLRTDVIPHGQPRQTPPLAIRRRVDLGHGMFVCGDHRDTASLQGAMFSGERTAQAVLAHLGRPG
jgi:glycine/D-amino acid oxidase-like deaminating enzyme